MERPTYEPQGQLRVTHQYHHHDLVLDSFPTAQLNTNIMTSYLMYTLTSRMQVTLRIIGATPEAPNS